MGTFEKISILKSAFFSVCNPALTPSILKQSSLKQSLDWRTVAQAALYFYINIKYWYQPANWQYFLMRTHPFPLKLATCYTRQPGHTHYTWNNDEGLQARDGVHINDPQEVTHFNSEYISNRLFWIGVPVTAHRAWACSLHTAMDVWTRGFFTLWASSNMIRAQTTWSKGAEMPWKRQSNSQHQYGDTHVPQGDEGARPVSTELPCRPSNLLRPSHWTKFRNQGRTSQKVQINGHLGVCLWT